MNLIFNDVDIRWGSPTVVSFADDLLVLIRDNSKHELEENGCSILGFFARWLRDNGFHSLASKTNVIMLRGLIE